MGLKPTTMYIHVYVPVELYMYVHVRIFTPVPDTMHLVSCSSVHVLYVLLFWWGKFSGFLYFFSFYEFFSLCAIHAFTNTVSAPSQLLKTGEEVAKLQADLEEMQPQLEQAQVETEQTMAKIEKDSGQLWARFRTYPTMGSL